MRHVLVILEDDPEREAALRACARALAPTHRVEVFDNAPDLVAWLESHVNEVGLASLDHDLGPSRDRAGERFDPGDGRAVASFLASQAERFPVVIHSANPPCADSMQVTLEIAGFRVARVRPLGEISWVEDAWAPEVAALLRDSSEGPTSPRTAP